MTRHRVFVTLTFLWMIMIFLMSAAPADDSTEMSLSVGLTIGRIFIPNFSDLDEEQQLSFAEKIDFPVRKAAHASEYAVLCLLFCLTLKTIPTGAHLLSRHYQKFAFLFTAIYAATDEFHQLFVPGRAGLLTDVLIDSCGAMIGLCIVQIFAAIRRRISPSCY